MSPKEYNINVTPILCDWRNYMDKINSFYKMLKYNAEKYPDKEAIIYDTMTVTYQKLFEDSYKKALHLMRFEGSRIAIYGPASYRWIVNMFGTILAGKDVMLVDFFLPQNTRNDILKKVGVDYILSSTNQYILADNEAIIITDAEKDEVNGLIYNEENVKEGNILMLTAVPQECDKAVVLTVSNIVQLMNVVCVHQRIRCLHRLHFIIYLDIYTVLYGQSIMVRVYVLEEA